MRGRIRSAGRSGRGFDGARGVLPATSCSRLVPRPRPEEALRYEYAAAGGLIHVDIKKLGRRSEAGPPGHRRPPRAGERKGRLAGTCSSRSTITADSGSASVYRDETSDSANAFLTEARPLLRITRDQPGAGPERQRQLLQTPLTHAGTTLATATASRRSGRGLTGLRPTAKPTIHPHPARALGLRLHLRARERQTRRPRSRPRPLQIRFRPHRALGGLTPLQRVNNLPGTYSFGRHRLTAPPHGHERPWHPVVNYTSRFEPVPTVVTTSGLGGGAPGVVRRARDRRRQR